MNNKKSFQPGVETLENREVMSTVYLSGTTLYIKGDDWANSATVKYSGSNIKVNVTSTPSNGFSLVPETINKTYKSSSVNYIKFYGNDGDDYFRNYTYKKSFADGGYGNDTLIGGRANDSLFGSAGNDYVHGYYGNDTVVGGSGNDSVYGYSGNDSVYGGSGNDYLHGGNGDDNLYGQSGQDTLRGGSGNDGLFGGGDGSSQKDYLYGDEGADRFLISSSYDYIRDYESADARINFWKGNASSDWTDREIEVMDVGLAALHQKTGNTVLLKDTQTNSPLEIYKSVSPAGKNYNGWNTNGYTQTWKTKTWNYTKWKWDHHYHSRFVQREIHIVDWTESGQWDRTNFSAADHKRAGTLVHEIGHNWDSTAEMDYRLSSSAAKAWNSFTKLSGWSSSKTSSSTKKSGDGNWYYNPSAVTNSKRNTGDTYGFHNPKEDWATSWQVYFASEYTKGYTSESMPSAKVKALDNFFASIAALS